MLSSTFYNFNPPFKTDRHNEHCRHREEGGRLLQHEGRPGPLRGLRGQHRGRGRQGGHARRVRWLLEAKLRDGPDAAHGGARHELHLSLPAVQPQPGQLQPHGGHLGVPCHGQQRYHVEREVRDGNRNFDLVRFFSLKIKIELKSPFLILFRIL